MLMLVFDSPPHFGMSLLLTKSTFGVFHLPLLLVVWLGLLAIKRLVMHPLSKYPGPRLAALTPLYKSYYEVIKGGRWLHHVDELHKVYGAVVRVGPNELHFNDPRAYNRIFSVNSQLSKDPSFYACFGVDTSTFGLMDSEQARLSRELMSIYFNRRSILQFESVIQTKVDKLAELLASGGKAFDMFYAFRCATMDIITTHCFQFPSQCLDTPGFIDPLLKDIQAGVSLLWTMKSFPWLVYIIPLLPKCIGGNFQDQCQAFMNVQSFVLEKIESPARRSTTVLASKDQLPVNTAEQSQKPYPPPSRPCIFEDIQRRFPSIDPGRVFHEGLSLIQAGSDPVANTCIVGFFHVLQNPSIHANLKSALKEAFPDPSISPSWPDLEKLPYLTAVIKESLRMSHGFVSSLPRVVGTCGVEICGYDIPANTTVSMSVVSVHHNPVLFPQPHQFRPERWLETKECSLPVVAFSKGPRMCLGINMAWAELYIFFGTMFRRLDMSLVNASPNDYDDFNDFFIPMHTGKSLQIRATRSVS